jgi:hypothetical protein
VRYLESRDDIENGNISAIAFNEMCPALLHAGVFEDSIKKITLIQPLISYKSVVMNRDYDTGLIPSLVAGALEVYDLPDLAAILAPRELSMINVVDQNGDKVKMEVIEQELSIIRSAYDMAGANEKLKIKLED